MGINGKWSPTDRMRVDKESEKPIEIPVAYGNWI